MKSRYILIAALFSSIFAFAQEGEIIYTDYNTGITKTFYSVNTNSLFLDLDKDGIKEWSYSPYDIWGRSFGLEITRNYNEFPYYENYRFQTTYVDFQNPSFPQLGDTLPNCQWDYLIFEQYNCFNHANPEDCDYGRHYMGVKQRVGEEDDWCYGWIEASVYTHTWVEGQTILNTIDLVVFSHAYCTIPNYPLRVGQISFDWAVSENNETHFATVHPNPASKFVTITGQNIKSAEVLNTLGQRVAAAQDQGEALQIDMTSLPTGVYFVRITDGEGRKCVRKVVKE